MNSLADKRGRAWGVQEYSLLALLVGLAIWVTRHEFGDILNVALRDQEQSHILLVPFVAAWLLYLRRGRVRYIRYEPSIVGLAIIGGGWFAIWFGHETDTRILQHVGALTVVTGAIVSVAGLLVIRHFLPVVLVFAFFIPVPGTVQHLIAIPLQQMAAKTTDIMLNLIGFTSEQIGNTVRVNGQDVTVGEACNGMRMVFALTLVVYAFAFSVPLKFSTKRTLIILSPLIALLCNIIRLVPTAIVYGYSTQAAAERFHDIAGWVMLPIALGLMIVVLRMLKWLELPVTNWRLAH